jgi:23S rRNA (adenine2503-C2)-methyltransferase
LRRELEKHWHFSTIENSRVVESKDGRVFKAVLDLREGGQTESVLMPNARERYSLCVSTQVGCPVGCIFCATGGMGFSRDLETLEIAEQYRFWRRYLENRFPDPFRISNIVIMGMGEPLLNYTSVKNAVRLWLAHTDVGQNAVTVSTVGILPVMESLRHDPEWPNVRIAISLHGADAALRKKLVPRTPADYHPRLKSWCREYARALGSRTRPLTVEYVMIRDMNDTPAEARKLADFLNGLERVKVNLIPWNAVPGSRLQPSPRTNVERFQKVLAEKGVFATIRKSLGNEIAAACGQLARRNRPPRANG